MIARQIVFVARESIQFKQCLPAVIAIGAHSFAEFPSQLGADLRHISFMIRHK
jgi:hypothetical protein